MGIIEKFISYLSSSNNNNNNNNINNKKQLMEFKRLKESEQSTECLHTIVLSELKVIKSQYIEIKNENMELKELIINNDLSCVE